MVVAWPRRELQVTLALALLGLVIAACLAWLHANAHAGGTSFCSLGTTLNCDRVALSPHSVQLGLPVAVWGAFGYALIAALAVRGLTHPRAGSPSPAGLLLLLSAFATAAAVALAVVSKVAIGSWCLLCAASWAISFGLLATSWRACRRWGRWRAIRDDLARLRAGGWRTVRTAAVLGTAVALTSWLYPRYWERRAPQAHAGHQHASSEAGGPRLSIAKQIARYEAEADAQRTGPMQVYEYSDYECPSCARMHELTRGVSGQDGISITRRHFPLDSSCNPAVSRQVHPESCALARAGICAEEQGRLAEMDDALFANQREHLPVETLASRAGLDLGRFRSCLASPETEKRLKADISAAIQDAIQATPSFVVDGKVYAGRLPPRLARRLHAGPTLD